MLRSKSSPLFACSPDSPRTIRASEYEKEKCIYVPSHVVPTATICSLRVPFRQKSRLIIYYELLRDLPKK